jgi:hypothetical protein
MKLTTLALSLLAVTATGCATAPPGQIVDAANLPNCFDSNYYDAQRDLFTMRNAAADAVNQQCALTVGPRGAAAAGSRLAAGSYTVYLANGGGGGAGGTQQAPNRGGGAGGGGAGAKETRAAVQLSEGVYRLTLGAGGPGGNACVFAPYYLSGGPGWAGSPSSIVRIATGEVVVGTPGADSYARPSRAQHDQSAGAMDGHGGSGPGQASGGRGGTSQPVTGERLAQPGQSTRTTGAVGMGGIPGGNEDLSSAGGGGGATSRADGGGGGGESPGEPNHAPQRGSLGSGGGGGEGGRFECDAGASGGAGFIALRPI